YLWIYDIDLQQANRQTLDQHHANSPASLLSGSITTLQNRFTVAKINKNQPGDWFKLQPKTPSDLFKWIQLHFIKGQLVDMNLFDNLGQLSSFTFTKVTTNLNLSSSLFNFSLPKTVDAVIN
nr:outer membrane lipoprotein carrier protein LolA [Hydrococcus sp. Prado102]